LKNPRNAVPYLALKTEATQAENCSAWQARLAASWFADNSPVKFAWGSAARSVQICSHVFHHLL